MSNFCCVKYQSEVFQILIHAVIPQTDKYIITVMKALNILSYEYNFPFVEKVFDIWHNSLVISIMQLSVFFIFSVSINAYFESNYV